MKRRSIFFIFMLLTMLTACGKKEGSGTPAPTTTPTEVTTPTPTGSPIDVMYTPENLFDYRVENNQVTIVGLKVNDATDIVIPEVIENCPVTAVGDRAFAACSNLKTVSLPEGLIAIGEAAFEECTSLRSVKIPNSVEVIGAGAFGRCGNLEYVRLPENLREIKARTFVNCNALTSMTFPDGVTRIGADALRGCSSIVYIKIPNQVEAIGESAFRSCYSLEEIVLQEGLKIIGAEAFSECVRLPEIVFPESVTKIDDGAFSACTALENVWFINENVEIGKDVFAECTSLKSCDESLLEYVIVDNKVTITGMKNMGVVSYYVIPDTIASCPVTAIGDYAFERCPLTNIKLPAGLESIGNYAFSYCKLNAIDIPEGVASIGDGAFAGDTLLKQVYIPDSVTALGRDAFRYCDRVSEATVPERFKEITTVETYSTYTSTITTDTFGRLLKEVHTSLEDAEGKEESVTEYISERQYHSDGHIFLYPYKYTTLLYDADGSMHRKTEEYDYEMHVVTSEYFDANGGLIRKIITESGQSVCYDGAGNKVFAYVCGENLQVENVSNPDAYAICEYEGDTCVRKIVVNPNETYDIYDGAEAVRNNIVTCTLSWGQDDSAGCWRVGINDVQAYYVEYAEYDPKLSMVLWKRYDCSLPLSGVGDRYGSMYFFFDMYYQFD
ncbi:MAG: leucine-rich repeat domain-containing protein [Lachnospiraceae bacterium]|nr:leucine-rich repeat domain-containing protein [Lachnospiraceae bacterium]